MEKYFAPKETVAREDDGGKLAPPVSHASSVFDELDCKMKSDAALFDKSLKTSLKRRKNNNGFESSSHHSGQSSSEMYPRSAGRKRFTGETSEVSSSSATSGQPKKTKLVPNSVQMASTSLDSVEMRELLEEEDVKREEPIKEDTRGGAHESKTCISSELLKSAVFAILGSIPDSEQEEFTSRKLRKLVEEKLGAPDGFAKSRKSDIKSFKKVGIVVI
jgi:hypothetical protein